MTPVVSVLVPVRNGMPWLPEAVESLRRQTLVGVEIVVIDDGSTDGTAAYLGRFRSWVRVLSQEPRGLAAALNLGLRHAAAPLVARLDADDTARPYRLAKQVAFLSNHPEVGLLGSGALEVDAAGHAIRLVTPPVDDAGLRAALIKRNPFVHSSVVFRREVVTSLGGYDERIAVAQDYDLWMRMARVTQMACLPEPLVTRRRHARSVTATRDGERLWTAARVRLGAIARGQYPVTALPYALRPLAGLALPRPLREAVRGALRPRVVKPRLIQEGA